MPYGYLAGFVEEMEEIRRKERLERVIDMAVAGGNVQKHQADSHMRMLRGGGRSINYQDADLGAIGIKVVRKSND